MLETKEQKTYFFISIALVAVLAVVTLWRHPSFQYTDTTDYAKQQQQAKVVADAYAKYLQSIQTDPNASAELFQTILTQADIKKEVQAELKTDQPITPPTVDEKSLRITSQSGQNAVVAYLSQVLPPAVDFNQKTLEINKQLFSGDASNDAILTRQYERVYKQMSTATIPKEALDVQKSLLSAYLAYGKLLDLSGQYSGGQNQAPWADVYQQYASMNQSFAAFNKNFNKLSDKYQLASLQLTMPQDQDYANKASEPKHSGFALIPEAHAIFGLGDITITIGDIPALIMDGIKQGAVASFSQFMSSFLDKMIQKIESNYKIANFLYYSDALVSGQYTDDYLNKYVGNKLDQDIIKQFIPQFSCNKQNQDLKPIFQAKASQYLGFDPQSVNPNDPNYYQKLSSVGDFLASPGGWEIYYQDLASQAESQAEAAASRELTSSGLKSPRDSLDGSISSSINNIVSAEKASLEAILELGINNSDSFVSQFVAEITQTLFTKFVFSGATTSPRGGSVVGVLKEQSTCLAAAQLTPLVPITGTQYQPPPPPPSPEDLLNEACAQLPRGCTTAPTTVTP